MVGKVALVAVVGHEDGAHKTRATYWNGEAMQSRDVNARRVPERWPRPPRRRHATRPNWRAYFG